MARNARLYFSRPVNMLMARGGELGIWIQRDDIEAWKSIWNTIEWMRGLAEDTEGWKGLPEGELFSMSGS